MRLATTTLALLLLAGAPAAASHSTATLVIRDPARDANFVNDGGEFGSGNMATPTSQPSLDLRRVELAPTRSSTGALTGFSVTLDLQAPVTDRTQLTLKTRTANCADILLQFARQDGRPHAQLVSGCSTDVRRLAVQVVGKQVRMTVPFSALPAKAQTDGLLQTSTFSARSM